MALLLLETIFIAVFDGFPSLVIWIFMTVIGLGALLCVHTGLKVYYEQRRHIELLGELHRQLAVFQRDHEKTRTYITELISSLEKSDYQAKILHIPLNPK